MKGRRVGTLTLGIGLVAAGVLYLVWTLVPGKVNLEFWLALWPVFLILLGAETLGSWVFSKEERLRYDFGGLILLTVVVLGCFGVAIADAAWNLCW